MFYISYIKGLFLGSFIFLLGRTADISISADSYFKLMKEILYTLIFTAILLARPKP